MSVRSVLPRGRAQLGSTRQAGPNRAGSAGVGLLLGIGMLWVGMAGGCLPLESSDSDESADQLDEASEALVENDLALGVGEQAGGDDVDDANDASSLLGDFRAIAHSAPGSDDGPGAQSNLNGDGHDPNPNPWHKTADEGKTSDDTGTQSVATPN